MNSLLGALFDYTDKSSQSRLYDAVVNDDSDLLTALVAKGYSLRKVDNKGETVLHFAASKNASRCIRAIINTITSNFDQDAKEEYINMLSHEQSTPIAIACSRGNRRAIKTLLKCGASPRIGNDMGKTPLHIICENADIKTLKALLENATMTDLDAKDCDGDPPLFILLRSKGSKKIECLRYLLNKGADPLMTNRTGVSSFTMCMEFGGEFRALLAQIVLDQVTMTHPKAVMKKFLDKLDNGGVTPLMMALHKSCPPGLIQFMLTHGADPMKYGNMRRSFNQELELSVRDFPFNICCYYGDMANMKLLREVTDFSEIQRSCIEVARQPANQNRRWPLTPFSYVLQSTVIQQEKKVEYIDYLLGFLKADKYVRHLPSTQGLGGSAIYITPFTECIWYPWLVCQQPLLERLVEGGSSVNAINVAENVNTFEPLAMMYNYDDAAKWRTVDPASITASQLKQAMKSVIRLCRDKGALFRTPAYQVMMSFHTVERLISFWKDGMAKPELDEFAATQLAPSYYPMLLNDWRFIKQRNDECHLLVQFAKALGYHHFSQCLNHQIADRIIHEYHKVEIERLRRTVSSLQVLCRFVVRKAVLRSKRGMITNTNVLLGKLPVPDLIIDYLCLKDVKV